MTRYRWMGALLVLLTGCATGAPVGYRGAAGTLRFQLQTAHDSRAAPAPHRQSLSEPEAELPSNASSCGGQALPPGWPHLSSSQEVLAPLLACASPARFVALQRCVDMPLLLEALDDWSAVRLGAMGPLRKDAAEILNRKRAAFLVTAAEEYGLARAEVFALFILHSAFDDELRQVLGLLSRDKQLGATLGQMASAREELRRRGVSLSDYPDRAERAGDALRGLGRAARDALASNPISDGARYLDLSAQRGQLPPPYQQALGEVERAQMEAAFSPGSVALGSFDHLTFGVPLGFYHLVAGTAHGAYSLTQGRYEQAARELAPAALMVALYAGGKGLRALSEATGFGQEGARRLQASTLALDSLKSVLERLGERLGMDGLGELARYIQANREAALLVCEGGEAAAVALYEARGDVARAQAWLSEAKPQRVGPSGTPTETPIRNAHLAGQKHPITGVPFDADGYPDFRAAGVVKAEVKIEYTGSRAKDFAAANKAAGLRETPKGMTWHHHQDGTTMQLVPTDVHARTGHTGGFSGGQQ